jgi:hypothetical protein
LTFETICLTCESERKKSKNVQSIPNESKMIEAKSIKNFKKKKQFCKTTKSARDRRVTGKPEVVCNKKQNKKDRAK